MLYRKMHPLQHALLALLLVCCLKVKKITAISRPRANNRINQISGISGGEVAVRDENTHTHDMAIGKLRIDFVKNTLTDRLRYVQTGKRMADFKTWLRKQGGDVTVKSFHGVDVDWEPLQGSHENENSVEDKDNGKILELFSNNKNTDGLFSDDCLDLDLPANILPSLYEGYLCTCWTIWNPPYYSFLGGLFS